MQLSRVAGAVLIALALGTVGCDESLSDLTGPTPDLEPTFSSIQQQIFSSGDASGRPACTNCHNAVGSRFNGLDLTAAVSYNNLVNVASGVYDVQAVHVQAKLVVTNTVPTAAYRGAGRPVSSYAIERLVDQAAHELGIDPAEFRRRNLVPKEKFPYKICTGFEYDVGDFQGVLDKDVPWSHAVALVSRLASDDVVLTLVKDGDHRLSRPEDLERMLSAVEGLIQGGD